MAISEKIQLLGAGVYKDIPDEITLKSMPTASELDYIGAEDFDATMLDSILPQCVEEKINFRNLLEIDYNWVCRCLRILNYGPYYTTGTIFCDDCGQTSRGEFQVDLRSINCIPLPPKFVNKMKISKDEFLDFNQDIIIHLPTIQEMLNADKDKAFQNIQGKSNREFARLCYMVSDIGGLGSLNPFEVKLRIQKEMTPADFIILKRKVSELTDYGLRAGGTAQCPKCHSKNAAFVAFISDRWFRPTLDNLRRWKLDRSERANEDIPSNATRGVSKHN